MNSEQENSGSYVIESNPAKLMTFITREETNSITIGIFNEEYKDNFQPFAVIWKDKTEHASKIAKLFKASPDLLQLCEMFHDELINQKRNGLQFEQATSTLKKTQ